MIEEAMQHVMEALHHVVRLWPEVLGGGLTYVLHTILHRFYHHVTRLAVRLMSHALRGGK